MEMTSRERLLCCFDREETDRVPWSPLIDGYYISSLPEQKIYLDIIETMRYIGCDIMERHVAMPQTTFKNVVIRREESHDGSSFRTWYETPVGNVFEERKYSGQTSFITRPFIEDEKDIRIYEYIVHDMCFHDDIENFVLRDRLIGDDGLATTSGMLTPIQQLLQHLAGVENTVYLMYDYPELMDELLEVMHEKNKEFYQVLANYPTRAVFAYEDTSSTVMSRSMFTDYSLPAINDYARILHESGKLFITHMCGCLNAFKEDIGKGLQDGVDSVCPPDTGDLYVWEARKAWGDNKIIIGGIDPPALSRMTVEESVKTAKEILDKMRGERGFILSTGDAVPYGTPIQNLIQITETVKQYC